MTSRKRTPDQPSTETSTATADPPAVATDTPPAANDNRPSFAERVGQRKRIADPFGSAIDTVAGVRFFDSKADEQVALKFEEKPSQAVIDKVKEHGYHWNSFHRIWAHSYGDSPRAVRIDGERLYQEVRQMIRQEKGIEAGQEIPF